LLLSLMPFWAVARDVVVNNQLVLTSIAVQGTKLNLVAVVPPGLGQVMLEMRPTMTAPWEAAGVLDVAAGGGEVTFTMQKPGEMQFFRKVGPSGDPFLGLAPSPRLCPRAQTMQNTRRGAFWPPATGVGCCQQDRPGCPRGYTPASP
jgi:hypothetical protein